MPKISVYIIESPSPINFLDGTSEGATLCAALKHAGVRAELFTVINEDMLFEAAERVLGRLRSQRDKEPDVLPVLHLSMHGSTAGITLTDRSAGFPWSNLGDLIDV